MNQLQVKESLPRVQVEKTLEASLQLLKDLSVQEKLDSDYNLVGYQVAGNDDDLKEVAMVNPYQVCLRNRTGISTRYPVVKPVTLIVESIYLNVVPVAFT